VLEYRARLAKAQFVVGECPYCTPKALNTSKVTVVRFGSLDTEARN